MSVYVPIEADEAASIIGEGVHAGLRKGTSDPKSHAAWQAIRDTDTGWSDALSYLIYGLESMGLALCRKEER